MITGADGGLKHYIKVLDMAGSSMETWKTRWTALINTRSQIVKDCELDWAMIS